jgi:hypothetical protein
MVTLDTDKVRGAEFLNLELLLLIPELVGDEEHSTAVDCSIVVALNPPYS